MLWLIRVRTQRREMEAKDTVMSWDEAAKDKELTQEDTFHCEQLAITGVDPSEEYADRQFEANYKEAMAAMQRCLTAEAQAEISFKAGKLEGRREVVEWMEGNCMLSVLDKGRFTYKDTGSITFNLGNLGDSEEWQAKLKEWGLHGT